MSRRYFVFPRGKPYDKANFLPEDREKLRKLFDNFLDSENEFSPNSGEMLDDTGISSAVASLKEAFARSNTAKKDVVRVLADIVNDIFPLPPPIPDKPPALWTDDRARAFATPRDFLENVYGPWLKDGLSWPYLYKHDRPLYNAVRYQLKKSNISLDDFLPSKSVLVQREIDSAGPEGVRAATRIHRNVQSRIAQNRP